MLKIRKTEMVEGSSFRLREEASDDSDEEGVILTVLKESREMLTAEREYEGSRSGHPPARLTTPAEGVEGYTLIHFHTGQNGCGRILNSEPL